MRVCEIENCSRKHKAKGYCNTHYKQLARWGVAIPKIRKRVPKKGQCIVNNCIGVDYAKGFCRKHYHQMWEHGEIGRTIHDPNKIIVERNVCKIEMYNRSQQVTGIAFIDRDDLDKIINYKWKLDGYGYACTTRKRKYLSMHNLIMGYKPNHKIQIDHKNNNKLDNRKANLRFSDLSQNNASRILFKNNTSGFRGVSWNKKQKKWTAVIQKDKKLYRLGNFADKRSAALSYNTAAKQLYGEFAYINPV